MAENDPPLEPMGDGGMYRHVVVDLAEYRIQIGQTPAGTATCSHRDLVYNRHERRIWCRGCKRTVDPFDAFEGIVSRFGDMLADAQRRQCRADDALNATARQRATKALDRVWAGNGKMAPCCPHCRRGLLPEDFNGGPGWEISRELEIARRRKETTPTPHGGTTG